MLRNWNALCKSTRLYKSCSSSDYLCFVGVITLINWCVFWHVTVSLNTCTRLNSNLFSRPVKQGSLQNLESPQLLGIVCRLAFLFRKGGKVNLFYVYFQTATWTHRSSGKLSVKQRINASSYLRRGTFLVYWDKMSLTKQERNPNISLRARFFYP